MLRHVRVPAVFLGAAGSSAAGHRWWRHRCCDNRQRRPGGDQRRRRNFGGAGHDVRHDVRHDYDTTADTTATPARHDQYAGSTTSTSTSTAANSSPTSSTGHAHLHRRATTPPGASAERVAHYADLKASATSGLITISNTWGRPSTGHECASPPGSWHQLRAARCSRAIATVTITLDRTGLGEATSTCRSLALVAPSTQIALERAEHGPALVLITGPSGSYPACQFGIRTCTWSTATSRASNSCSDPLGGPGLGCHRVEGSRRRRVRQHPPRLARPGQLHLHRHRHRRSRQRLAQRERQLCPRPLPGLSSTSARHQRTTPANDDSPRHRSHRAATADKHRRVTPPR